MTLSRPYVGDQDLTAMVTFLAQARSEIRHVHHLHVGDLVWQLGHMHAGVDPATIVHLWHDVVAGLRGFVLVYPGAGFFNLDVRSDARGSAVEADMLRWAEQRLQATPGALGTFSTLVNEHDAARRTLLEHRGYTCGDPWLYLERSLIQLLPTVATPSGFQVRPLAPAEVDARAAALAAAFGAPTEVERYRHLMATPGYDRTLDSVAVATDGQVGAFALGWLDQISKVGQFEPVGTAPAYRRLGLGRAVLLHGMEQLKQRGGERVVVIVEATEDAAVRLYESVGLARQWQLFLYSKTYA